MPAEDEVTTTVWECVHADGTRHDAPEDLMGPHACDETTDEHGAVLRGHVEAS